MDDLTAADYRLLLSLLDNAIMPEGPQQRERIASVLRSERMRREISQQRKDDLEFVYGDVVYI